ncbi:porin family protein [Bradyrhizobium diazoefficiens]|jgi:outer membrane immunogenic protein|nr:outer membrane beta-barrel protein [Bradyrhizobium diazoefficiens]MBR0968310.1 porin family protein [Bradyrhizobium diazoefficiens]MBR0977419.1 porin family protein [Bradyrhizobium diazoefficiens]MBR1007899.1 porin family protein [Bradyrhizobium diazoefficiens]MBR1013484.1 porin family protein [Bradyrhizobium diazoefficiens]MBR1050576.1 porin family protein [Bradyrhizobium diazoefficiens]
MRRLLLAAVMLGTVSAAHAADLSDLPILRGSFTDGLSKTSHNWDGAYVGGGAGYTADATDFTQSVRGLTNFIFRDSVLQQPTSTWSLMNKTNTQSTNFNAFVGRNWQWYDAIMGLEGTYSYFNNLATSSSGSNSLIITNPAGDNPPAGTTDNYNVTLTGTAAAKVKDMISLRGRVGWDGGDFMPYAFFGAAVGRMDVSRTVTSDVTLTQVVTTTGVGGATTTTSTTYAVPAQSQTQSQHRTNTFAVGWTAGLGLEYCIWNGLFARVEYEYVRFSPIMNTQVTLNNARLGLGYKF